jgi:hypothetical protein
MDRQAQPPRLKHLAGKLCRCSVNLGVRALRVMKSMPQSVSSPSWAWVAGPYTWRRYLDVSACGGFAVELRDPAQPAGQAQVPVLAAFFIDTYDKVAKVRSAITVTTTTTTTTALTVPTVVLMPMRIHVVGGLSTLAGFLDPEELNLGGVVNGLRAFVPGLLSARQPASILITASLAGLATWPGGGPYAAAKHEVVARGRAGVARLGGVEHERHVALPSPCPLWNVTGRRGPARCRRRGAVCCRATPICGRAGRVATRRPSASCQNLVSRPSTRQRTSATSNEPRAPDASLAAARLGYPATRFALGYRTARCLTVPGARQPCTTSVPCICGW